MSASADSQKPAPLAALIRHGAYFQRDNAPSALQPFPLTREGEAQACACGKELATLLEHKGLMLAPFVHCSRQLRAWQTARIACDVLAELGHTAEIIQTPALAERSVGSAANLTLNEIENVLADDPRFDAPPPGWKSDSHYCLPLDGAESLMMAGERVARHLQETMASASEGTMTLFFGHGASFRHAAYLLGVLEQRKIARVSMYHGRPLQVCRNADGTWAHTGGEWKIRQSKDPALD